MDKDFVLMFVGKKVKIDVDLDSDELYFYEGFIKHVSDDSLVFEDKFGRLVSIMLSRIVRIEEVRNGNHMNHT